MLEQMGNHMQIGDINMANIDSIMPYDTCLNYNKSVIYQTNQLNNASPFGVSHVTSLTTMD